MNELPNELRAVLSAPDDDAPRVAYADALDARGEPEDAARARFVRAQLSLGNLSSAEADSAPEALEALKLEDASGEQWAAMVLTHSERAGFYRGFVEHVHCSAATYVAHGGDLRASAPILHVTITKLDTSLDALLASPHIVGIRSLSLDRMELTDTMLEQLSEASSLSALRWLSIAKNRVTQRGGEALAASVTLPALSYVRFFGNDFDPSERQGHDQGVVVERWLPQQGRDLEAKFGSLRWLHVGAQTLEDVVPDRFRIA
ncbi:MAG: TIGR02996 domain-containing protein [Nannocystaceae bacterium]|nr:TIGR02996 domain-containing protein [Nannocystaceae bacterium]